MTDAKNIQNGEIKEPNKVQEKQEEKSKGYSEKGHGHSHKKPPEIVNFKTHLTTLAKICCVVYCYTIIKLCFQKEGFDYFTWHPLFMTLGYMLCMTAGFYVLNKNNTYLRKKTKGGFRVTVHIYLLSVGYVLSIVGLYFVYRRKDLLNKAHFTSWHGVMGIIALLSNLIPVINGTVLHWEKELRDYITLPGKRTTKFVHVISGCLCYGAGSVALLLTPYTKWFIHRTSGSVFTFYLAFITVLLSLVWALYGPGVKTYHFLKDKIDEFKGIIKQD